MKEILDKAKEGSYAVAAPNVYDQHTLLACLGAAEEERSPLIIDWGERDGDIFIFAKVALALVQDCTVPVAINLDHGGSFEIALKAIRAGFTSVMVEAELGHIVERNQDTKDETLNLTDPEEAREFVEQTGVDCLAVAIGTVHGLYKGIPLLDFDRLKKIRNNVNVPLVLHGGSNTGDAALQKTIKSGICKINLATDLFNAGMESLRSHLASDLKANLVSASIASADGFKQALIHYIRLFYSGNKA
jgi:fructose-bisphosphate aldolase class II